MAMLFVYSDSFGRPKAISALRYSGFNPCISKHLYHNQRSEDFKVSPLIFIWFKCRFHDMVISPGEAVNLLDIS